MDEPAETSEVPRARLEQRRPVQLFVIITARRVGSDSVVTVEMSSDEWFDLPPVRQALQDELKRRKLSRRSLSRLAHGQGCSLAIPPSNGIPGGYVERRDDGSEWVVVTAAEVASKVPVTFEMPMSQWREFMPVQWVIEDELERREEAKAFRGYRDPDGEYMCLDAKF